MKPYKAIIFDWDGTLADSTMQIATAMQQAFSQAGLAEPSVESVRSMIGLSLEKTVFTLADVDQDKRQQVIDNYRRNYLSSANRTYLFSDAQAVLSRLHEHFILGVATGKGRQGLERAMQDTNAKHWFSGTRTADECTSKPAPDMVLSLCEEWDILPFEALVVGDTTHDLLMAQHAQADAVAVTTGAHSVQMLASVANLGIFPSLSDVARFLGIAIA